MPRKTKISPTMADALEYARKHGELVRKPGGYWTWESAELRPHYDGESKAFWSYPWHAGTKTIHGLIDRGLLQVSRQAKWGVCGVKPVAAAAIDTTISDGGHAHE